MGQGLKLCDVLSDGEEVEPGALDQLSDNVRDELRRISSWLLDCGYETDFMQVYASIRSSLLIRSLTKLVSVSLSPNYLLFHYLPIIFCFTISQLSSFSQQSDSKMLCHFDWLILKMIYLL